MKSQPNIFLLTFTSFFLLCLSTIPSWAAPLTTSSSSGLCCADGVLKESTEKQCRKDNEKYYSVKEKLKAVKECTAQETGFCCTKGTVKKSTQPQCSKYKGRYYKNQSLAKKECKPETVFCCANGKTIETTSEQCKKRNGKAYLSKAEAKKQCKAKEVYCCLKGKIKKMSVEQCKKSKGKSYKTTADAKRQCKPEGIYCCVDGKVTKTSSKQCRAKKGKEYKTKDIAKKSCQQKQGYCCVDGKTTKTSSKQCEQRKGTFYKTAFEAKKKCEQGKGYCCADGAVTQLGQKECRKKKGKYYKSRQHADKTCKADKTRKPSSSARANLRRPVVTSSLPQSIIKPGAPQTVTPSDGAAMLTRVNPVNRRGTLGGVEDRSNWPVIRGFVSMSDNSLPDSVGITSISIAGTAGDSPAMNAGLTPQMTNATQRLGGDGSYRFVVPPHTSIRIQPDFPSNPFNIQSIESYTYTSSALQTNHTHNFIIDTMPPGTFNQDAGTCTIHGTTRENGLPINRNLVLRINTVRGTSLGWPGDFQRTIAVSNTDQGNYSFQVPMGSFNFNIDFQTPLDNHERDGLASTSIRCEPAVSPRIDFNFNFIPHEFITISGQVNVDDRSRNSRVRAVHLTNLDTREVDEYEIGQNNRTSSFRWTVPGRQTTYSVAVILKDGNGNPPPPQIIQITRNSNDVEVNFDIQLPASYLLGELKPGELVSTAEGSPSTVRFTIGTHTLAYDELRKNVRLTMGTNTVTESCLFDNTSYFSSPFNLSLQGVNLHDDSLTAEVLDDTGRVVSTRVYRHPFRELVGDLMAKQIFVRLVEGGHGASHADVYGYFKNIGPGKSLPCQVQLELPDHNNRIYKKDISAHEMDGRYRRLKTTIPIERLNVGDTIVLRIKNDCGGLRNNNVIRYTIQESDLTHSGGGDWLWDPFPLGIPNPEN